MSYIILPSVAYPAVPHISTCSQSGHVAAKFIECTKCVSSFSTILSASFLSLRRIQTDIITAVHRCSCTVPVIIVRM